MVQQQHIYLKWLYILLIAAVLINFSALFVTIIGPDGTYYAGIAKTMVWRHDYVNLYAQGTDFLDKPHFPFWVTALSFHIFGISTAAYKLPGILFMMAGAIYTYLFARRLYNQETALWAALILLTAQHIVISNNDVRAEPYLTGLIIGSIYHFYRTTGRNSLWQLLFGSVLAAFAVMTKGMFALIPIGGAIGGHLLITRQWAQVFHWRWLAAALLIAVFILPEVYCLNVQFDRHPEKVIFGVQHVSGIKWFLWDSQIGRFFNTGPIKGSGDPFFFVHTLLWAFLPWSLLLFAAIFQGIKQGSKKAKDYQWYCLCGALLTFLVFSASRFQLPYYLNIVFPLFAIELAAYMQRVHLPESIKAICITQGIVIVVLLVLVIALQYFFRPQLLGWPVIVAEAVLLCLLFVLLRQTAFKGMAQIVVYTLLTSFMVNIFLNGAFYPSLLKYQSGSEAAFFINRENNGHMPVAQTGDNYSFPLEFYLKQPLITISPDGNGPTPSTPFILYGNALVIKGLANKGWHIQYLQTFDQYWISMLKPAFINHQTRQDAVSKAEVVLVNRIPGR